MRGMDRFAARGTAVAALRGALQRPARLGPALAGAAALLLGVAALLDWFAHGTLWTLRVPAVALLQPSAAAGIALCGAGVLASAAHQTRLATGCGCLAAALGLLALAEYTASLSLGFDTLLLHPLMANPFAPLGRMSPAAATCLVLAGSSLVAAPGPAQAAWRWRLGAASSGLVLATAVAALAGYLGNLMAAPLFSLLRGMSVPATLGFLLVSAGLLGMAWRHAGVSGRRAATAARSAFPRRMAGLLSLGVGLFLASVAVLLLILTQGHQVDRVVRHSQDLVDAIGRLEFAIVDKDNGLHGYLLSADPEFLQAFTAGLASAAQMDAELALLTAGDAQRQARLGEIHRAMERWDDFARGLIDLERSGQAPRHTAMIVANAYGKTMVDDLRRALGDWRTAEMVELRSLLAQSAATQSLRLLVLLVCLGAAVLISVAQFALARRVESQRRSLEEQVAQRQRAEMRVREAIAALEQSEQRFRQLVELAPHAMVIVDRAGTMTLVNSQVLAWFGYAREELLGKPVEALIPERFRAGHPGHMAAYFRTPVARSMGTGRELYGRRKDSSEFPVDISLSPVETAEGLRVIASIADITESRNTENRLRQVNQEAQAVNKELQAFAYSVSHDLRAPLRAMVGFAQILREDYGAKLEAGALEHIQRIQAAGKRMGELIDGMLSLSRITRGELTVAQVDLTALAESVAQELRHGEPDSAVQVTVGPGLVAPGDARLLRVVLQNLMGNAWKFSSKSDHPHVEVGMLPSDGPPTFFVRDNGAGFDMAHADKLFGAFQRLHSAGQFPGTGIGLATVQRIIHRHGGKVWAEAQPGRGATFYFTLA
ncbi:MAG TPA: PAS domain S-box protein [bacterium]|nr:PAS domain S-box protein [bacterium]